MKGFYSLLGFLMFLTGLIALSLSLVGIKLRLLSFLDNISPLFGFVTKVVLVVAGIVIVILARTDWEKENQQPPL